MILTVEDVEFIKDKRPSDITSEDVQNLIDTLQAMQIAIKFLRTEGKGQR